MINRTLFRRLEHLEDFVLPTNAAQLCEDSFHVLGWRTGEDARGEVGTGAASESSSRAIASLQVTVSGALKFCTTRNLYRRLQQLEEEMMPEGEPHVIQVVLVDSDGSEEMGPRFEIPHFRPVQGRWRGVNRPRRWAPMS